MPKILVPTDFSTAAENALELACRISAVGNQEIELLHVTSGATEKLLSEKGKTTAELEEYLAELCQKATSEHAVKASYRVEEGNILTVIPAISCEPHYLLVMMGTHGSRGLRQKLFGADGVKIAERSPIPVLTVPEAFDVTSSVDRIIFPYGGSENFDCKVKAVAMLASHFNADVHFYSVDRLAAEASETLYENIEEAEAYFTGEGIAHQRIKEEMTEYSVGFANQTIKYAERAEADLIAVMANDGGNLSFITALDRENLINNEKGIAILLISE